MEQPHNGACKKHEHKWGKPLKPGACHLQCLPLTLDYLQCLPLTSSINKVQKTNRVFLGSPPFTLSFPAAVLSVWVKATLKTFNYIRQQARVAVALAI